MLSVRRLIALCCFCAGLAAFWWVPQLLAFGPMERDLLTAFAQIGGPLAAAIGCYVAARHRNGGEKAAWYNFAIGSTLYLGGNLFYVYYAVAGIEPVFPTLPEAAYFVMALFFAAGIFQYGKVTRRISRVQFFNFLLIYCAITLGSLFTLSHSLSASVLSPFGTVVAFLYPALWFSVATSGLISLLLYDQGNKSFPFALLLLGVLAESVADYSYVLQLMDGSYSLGGLSQLLWVASAALIAWAALEHITLTRHGDAMLGEARRRTDRGMVQAALPGLAIATILLAGSGTGALGAGPYVWLSAGLAVVFALVVGLREHWMIHVQRELRSSVERSRGELLRSEERLSAVLESTSDSVLVLDRDWNVVYFNRHAVETINLAERLHIGISVWDLFPAALTSGEGDHYKRAVETRQPAEFEIFVEDRKVWLGIQAYPTPEGLSIFFRDISEPRRIREESAYMARHDALTGLANRALFQERLREALASGLDVATLLLDLDHFKEVNDTLGHPVGDALLVGTAQRLASCIGPRDTVARLGGDEFAIIVVGFSGIPEITRLAQRVLDAANAPHTVEGQTVRIGASAGIALSLGNGDDPERIFRNADIALYAAKADARGVFRFFEHSMEAGLLKRQALRADMDAGLQRGEFELAYQPILDLRRSRVCSFEALLRWRHPRLGLVSPDLFIPLAEESGLIVALGEWVLRTACAEAANWPVGVSVAVNLSTRQFANGDLSATIEDALNRSGLPATRLELEITESVLLKDSRANLLTLRRLRARGIRIALDDFGTGYSSLGYLQRFAFSKLKIDRSFIAGLPANEESQAIVRSVIGLGQALGMRVTAEGVETQAQFDWIRTECDEAQGYLLSRPIPAADIPALLDRIGAVEPGWKAEPERLAG